MAYLVLGEDIHKYNKQLFYAILKSLDNYEMEPATDRIVKITFDSDDFAKDAPKVLAILENNVAILEKAIEATANVFTTAADDLRKELEGKIKATKALAEKITEKIEPEAIPFPEAIGRGATAAAALSGASAAQLGEATTRQASEEITLLTQIRDAILGQPEQGVVA